MSLLPPGTHTVVLVEGASDRNAVEALALRHDRRLGNEGIAVLAMGGATNVGRYVERYGPGGEGHRVLGLCDYGELDHFERAFGDLGHSADGGSRFFVCDADLEEELIRAMGVEAVLDFIEARGELRTFSIMQRQPAQRDRTLSQQLHRFIGVRSGRKDRYAVGLIELLDLGRTPRPLERLLKSL